MSDGGQVTVEVAPPPAVVIEIKPTVIDVTVEPPPAVEIVIGAFGPQGPSGPAGATGPPGPGGVVQGTAGMDLSGQMVVTTDTDGLIVYASSDELADRVGPFWLTMTAALNGQPVQCLTLGEFTEPSWAWTPPAALFLGVDGVLSLTPPDGGFSVQVAVAIAPTTVFFDPLTPIVLAS